MRSTIGTDTADGVVQPEGVTVDITTIELEPFSSSGSPGSPRRPARARSVAGWLAIGLAVVATGTLGMLVVRDDAAGSRTSIDETDVEQSAAALPAAAADPRAAAATEKYLACLPRGAGSADALERRGAACRHDLEQAVFPGHRNDPCLPAGAGSADGMERWVENCRRKTIGLLLAASTAGG